MATQMICSSCGSVDEPLKKIKGSGIFEIILYFFFIIPALLCSISPAFWVFALIGLIPGLMYSGYRRRSKYKVCSKCNSKEVIPLDSPRGRELSSRYHPEATLQEVVTAPPLAESKIPPEAIERNPSPLPVTKPKPKSKTRPAFIVILVVIALWVASRLLFESLNYLHSNHKSEVSALTEEKEKNDVSSLLKFKGKYPFDIKLFEIPFIKTRLTNLLSSNLQTFLDRFGTVTPIQTSANEIFVSGCLPHMCGDDMALFSIDVDRNIMFVGLLVHGKMTIYSENNDKNYPEIFAKGGN